MNPSDIIDFISKHQSLIASIATGVLLASKLIAKNILNIETKSDRKRTIKSDLDIAKYLVDPSSDSDLVNQMAFEALTGKKASLETIEWLLNCHDPSTALEIYASAPSFIKIKKKSLYPVKWVKKYAFKLYYLSLIISVIILILVSLFTFYGVDLLVKVHKDNPISDSQYLLPYIFLYLFFVLDILGLLWIMSVVSNYGVFLAKVRRFYDGVLPSIITTS